IDVAYGGELVAHVSRIYSEKTGKSWTPALVSNERLSNHEILSLASACRVFAGMRLHSLIITAQSGTPVVGLVYAPKVKSFLYQLNTPEFAVSLATLTPESLYGNMLDALANVDKLRETQQAVVRDLRMKAEESATFLRTTLGVQSILRNDEATNKVVNG
ncbi:MAG: polysaccharide pyruvyl transferase family protein, partial [bacterium]|nr:polysaccharide pyruvyl transferase family protein [bacterium]